MKRRDFLKYASIGLAAIGIPTAGVAAGRTRVKEGTLVTEDIVFPPHGPFVPEQWAEDSLKILEENMVIGNIVHRDFETLDLNKLLDVDLSRLLDELIDRDFTPWVAGDYEPAHLYCAFMIRDSDRYKSMEDIVTCHLHPAMLSLAREINRCSKGVGSLWLTNELLPLPPSTMGVLSHMSDGGRIPLRCSLEYDACIQGTRVTIDCLMRELKQVSLLSHPYQADPNGRPPRNLGPRSFA